MLVVLAGCFDTGDDEEAPPPPTGQVRLRGACAQPVAADGGVVFPDTAVSVQRSRRVIDLVNDGELAIALRAMTGMTIEGPDAAEFAVITDPEGVGDSQACSATDFGLPDLYIAGQGCHFAISFFPSTPGVKEATLHILKTGGGGATIDQAFPIHATAVPPPATVFASVTELYFAVSSFPQSLQIRNADTSAVVLGDPVVSPPFMLASWSCPPTLAPGGACTASVQYGPALGGCSGTLSTTLSSFSVPLFARQ